jgi:hypothetical protein
MIPQSLRARRQSTDNSAGELASLELPQLLQALPIAALAFDTFGRVLGLNDRARTLLDHAVDIGASSEHIFGSVKIHQHQEQVGSLRSIVTEVIRGGVPVRSAEAPRTMRRWVRNVDRRSDRSDPWHERGDSRCSCVLPATGAFSSSRYALDHCSLRTRGRGHRES